jgi:hypothetical protein
LTRSWTHASFLCWPAFDAARDAVTAADVQRMQKIRDVIGGSSQTRLRLWLPIAIT